MDTILFDPNTGRRLNPGETVIDKQTGRSLTQGTSFTSGTAQPDPGMPSYAPGGASGRFDGVTTEEGQAISEATEQSINYGVPLAQAWSPKVEPIIPDGAYKGMTMSQANVKKAAQGEQDSAMTSYSFDPASISGTSKSIDKFNLALTDLNSSPFSSMQSKEEKKSSMIDITASDIAKNFNSAQDFYTTYQNNPELQATLKPFIDAGGKVATIASKVTTATNDIVPEQDTATYLDMISKKTSKDPFEQQALDALSPENELVQNEIARMAGIASEYKKLYFGDGKTIGILEEQKKIAEDKKKLIEEKELNAKTTERDRLAYNIEKNNADVAIAKAEIETNRLKAKNQMTRTLAKLGALKTSGNAPLALETLEQKYQQQKQQLDTKLKFANRALEIDSAEKINSITEKADELTLKIQEDLSKSSEEVAKELFKIEAETASKIFTESSKAYQELRKLTDTYHKEAQSNADKYNSNFMMLAGKGVDVNKIASMIDSTGRVDTTKLTNSMFASKTGTAGGKFDSVKFDSKATESFFNDLPKDFRDSWQTNFPAWMGTGTATTKAIKADYQEWLKNNPGGKTAVDVNKITLTPTQRTKLIKQGTDVTKYLEDPEYRQWVDDNSEE